MYILQMPVDTVQVNVFVESVKSQLAGFGFKLIGAILLWVVGQWLIKTGVRLLSRLLKRQSIEPTLVAYLANFLNIALKIILIVAILGYFGVETTSFAALLAAAGIAIGAAWGGLLANFAAGVFLVIFRPFAVGDFIATAGVIGTVEEIGLFVTVINTMDNVRTIIGNNKIFSDNIQNFSANPYRRVDLVAQLNHSVNYAEAINLLQERLRQIPNVMENPQPDVEILEFNLAGPVLAVRPYCHNENYWQVYFDTNKTIRETLGSAGYPAPEQHYVIRQSSAV
ncbi:mechanosensitive ion channel family protein [Crocosphaera sp. UHCC 0190]|uniref:mechanosensitive ion channel family protein n=1 Tax=Crocosphaera sp. UHCC 0190 TaxID=3110246 RepID=UPI002B1EFDC3|nr:mechanosensitive ion channel family protein [Crocosphaera sp. UHCC 0190]MEA5510124.1 mechanosensitive ion channel family protein [Crocosphaera sp. UHCC 0190]